MHTPQFLADRLEEVLLSGTWIANTNFKHQIGQVNRLQATQRIGNLNTIALLTFHINYYLQGVSQVLEGGTLDIKDRFSFDMPALQTDNDWHDLVSLFCTNATKMVHLVRQLDPHTLNEVFVDEKYGTYLRNIEGIIEHSYYHLGQISLIRKLVTQADEALQI